MLTYAGKMILQGKKEALVDQLRTKFGQLPPEIPQQVSAIDQIEEVDGLLREIITANSLEEMGLNNHRRDNAE